MNEQLTIEDGRVVALHYTLTTPEGQTLDQSELGDPLYYLHGASNIVPGLENALTGHKVGDRLNVRVAPEDGYGERLDPGPQPVERENFPPGMEIVPGMQFMAQGEDGDPLPLWVVGVDAQHVFIDHNHPLAGVTLIFDVTVVDVRAATEAELEHGHPHGPDGTFAHDHDHGDEDFEDDDFEDEDQDEDEGDEVLDAHYNDDSDPRA